MNLEKLALRVYKPLCVRHVRSMANKKRWKTKLSNQFEKYVLSN
jgi:hypothetical protein